MDRHRETGGERRLAGCFVLLTNVPTTGDRALDAKGVLRTYKGQYGVESEFAFLKDPLVVNDLFIKTPSRIDALGGLSDQEINDLVEFTLSL